jgi:hypothetical protein
MKTVKISPLGAYMIAFYVTHWNTSNESGLKRLVKTDLLSDNAKKVQDAVGMIRSIVRGQFYVHKIEPDEVGNLIHKASKALSLPSDNVAVTDKVNTDIAFYFTTVFKQGYFEQIPMPEFYIDLEPDIVVEKRILSPDGKISVKGPRS